MKAKFDLVNALKEHGFQEVQPAEGQFTRNGWVALERKWSATVEVAWFGALPIDCTARAYVDEANGLCRFEVRGGCPDKNRWYESTGKRTYNAIAETIRNIGYGFEL